MCTIITDRNFAFFEPPEEREKGAQNESLSRHSFRQCKLSSYRFQTKRKKYMRGKKRDGMKWYEEKERWFPLIYHFTTQNIFIIMRLTTKMMMRKTDYHHHSTSFFLPQRSHIITIFSPCFLYIKSYFFQEHHSKLCVLVCVWWMQWCYSVQSTLFSSLFWQKNVEREGMCM